jgi:predicted alpha-1,6-mannanase (GH76 family)
MITRDRLGRLLAGAALTTLVAVTACADLLGIKRDRPLASAGDDDAMTEGGSSVDGADIDVAASDSASDDAKLEAGALIDPASANLYADKAIEAMLLNFWRPQYLTATTTSPVSASSGSFAQAWEVVVDAAQRHKAARRYGGTLAMFYDARDQSAAGWVFSRYDEEVWMTLALLRAHALTDDSKYLLKARTLYEDIILAWDSTCCPAAPSGTQGGIWRDTNHTQKSTVVNGAAVIAAARLYERTGASTYLAFAKKVYEYWSMNMVDSTTHRVSDNISPLGIQGSKYTYNAGLMIGAAVALAHATKDQTPLTLAHQVAQVMLSEETKPSPAGTILDDGSAASCEGECPQSKGIAARYVAALYASDPTHVEYLALLSSSAAAAVTIARDATTGLYGTDWASPYPGEGALNATISAAATLAVVAELLGDAPADPPATYQAEEGILHSVSLENIFIPFEGWGYVAYWDKDGQGVDFLVTVPATSNYTLGFRYAATANASRELLVNGTSVSPAVLFPSTGVYTGWTSKTPPAVLLQAGMTNTVSLTYNNSRGNYGAINLDQLVVVEAN